jgi:hypothetical protein
MITDKGEPTAKGLKQALGNRYELFETLLAAHPDLRPEWKYYGEKYGWSLKLFEKRRNLCFVTPRAGDLRVAFTFGDKQYEQVMSSGVPASVKKQLADAKRYMEGRGVSLLVEKPSHLKTIEQLLCIKRGALTA